MHNRPMLLDADECQLVLVDYQERLMPAAEDGPGGLRNAVKLGTLAPMFGVPVWGTEENPAGLGPLVPQVRSLCTRVLSKMHFSSCADGLQDLLRPPARQGGNARSLPRHLQKNAPAGPERPTVVIAGS